MGIPVCPAEFALGETAKAMVDAMTEGEEFDLDLFLANLDAINPGVRTILASAKTGEGLDEVCR